MKNITRYNTDNMRMYNIELMRIVAMMLVITTHFWGHGIDLASIPVFTFPYYFGWLMKGISYVCINSYVLISAYFLCQSKFKIQKLIFLWLEIEFYSVLIYIVSVITGLNSISIKELIMAVFPVCTSEYWFVTIYVGLFLLYPIVNFVIKSMNKKQHLATIAILCALFVVIPNVFFFSKWLNYGAGYGIVWFVVLYFIGSYIRLYTTDDWIQRNKNVLRVLTAIFLILPFISRIIIAFGTKLILGKVVGSGLFFSNNSILVVPATILFFLLFLTVDIKSVRVGKVISFFSAGSFAVYLIHDNPVISDFLWTMLVNKVHLYDGRLIIEFVLIVIGIYLVCSVFDFFRRIVFKPISKLHFYTKIDLKLNNLFKV